MRTTPHTRLDSRTRDRLALYLLGGMSEGEAENLEGHLDLCPPCRREVTALRPVVDGLALSAPEAEPPPELLGRLMDRVRRERFTLLPAAERAWLPAGVPGVEICQLWLDGAGQRHTALIRMEAGASLPAHRHGGPEECYVVQGDLRDTGFHMHTGDYVRFEDGTSHTVCSDGGCLLLVTASLHDRRVEPAPAAG